MAYQLRGIVDVPSEPLCDDERDYLAARLFKEANIPDKEKRGLSLISWRSAKGGSGITVNSCRPPPVINASELIEIKRFIPPDYEKLDESHEISTEQHNEWSREYELNQYCRFEPRKDLHQRKEDIFVNSQVLKVSGKMGLTSDPSWFRLLQHVITELTLRGQPNSEKNHHPEVRAARPFFDGELCRKAAAIVEGKGTSKDLVVKYGQRQHMKDLFEKGLVYLNVASDYDRSNHNPAIRDDERTVVFKGAFTPIGENEKYYNNDNVPKNVAELTETGKAAFSTIFDCPSLEPNEYAEMKIQLRTNYWMFCLSACLDQRLFADFEADSCVIIEKEPFMKRLFWTSHFALPETKKYFGPVSYVDPLGVTLGGNNERINPSMAIHMTKVFRYTYQKEIRFVCLPRHPKEDLKPRELLVGPLTDIAQLITF